MDRSWVSIKNRACKEYENGVEAFLRFALEHGCDSTRMICPCKDCCYSRLINVDEVREHLIYRGIISDYTRWIWHGEKSVAMHSTASEEFVHSDVSIGMEQVQIWLDKKELDMCHVSIYLRYLFETRCKGVDDIFGFLSPTLVSPHANSGSLKDRATYIANSMKGNIENKLFFAPYKIGPRWVLLVLNPHYGYAYWIDPAQKGQELDADKLIDLSFTFKFMDLQKNKPRKQILWHIVKCPQHQTVIESGYYVLRFIKEIMRRNSISVPKIWYGKKKSLSESEIDEIRREWIEYLLQLMF